MSANMAAAAYLRQVYETIFVSLQLILEGTKLLV